MTDAADRARRLSARQGAEALEAVATLTWAIPLVFCLTYGFAWFFSMKNLLLGTGHIAMLFSASLVAEAASRLGDRPKLRASAQLTQVLALITVICLVYAFYPLIRMFLDSDEPFFAAIEAKEPAGRLAAVMTLAFALGAATLTAFMRLLAQAADGFGQKLGRLPVVIIAVFLVAALASALHASFEIKLELRDLRHVLAAGLVGLAVLVYLNLYPAIQRVAQCLQREAAQEV